MTTLKNILIAAVALSAISTVCALCVSFVVRSLSHTSTPVPAVPAPSIPMINTPGRTFPSVHVHYPAPAKAILALAKYANTQLGAAYDPIPGDSPNTSRLLADTRTVITDVQHDPVARRVKDGYLEQALVFVGGYGGIPSVCPRCALLLDDAL